MQLLLSRSLHVLVSSLDRVADRILRAEYDISYAQFLVLYGIAENSGAAQRTIAEWMGVTESSASRTIRVLAEQGRVVIGAGGGHRRAVELTPAGRRLVDQAGVELERRLAAALAAADVDYDAYAASTERLLATVMPAEGLRS